MLTDRLQKSNPIWKHLVTAASTTVAIWSPRSSASIHLAGLNISAYGAATSTVSVFFSTSTTTRGVQVGLYTVDTSTVLALSFPGLAGGMDVPLNIVSSPVGVSVTAFGFEE